MSLKAPVSAPSSSREVTGRVTVKSPSATARVPCVRRTIGRASPAARPTAPATPTASMASVIPAARVRPWATASTIPPWLKPTYAVPTRTWRKIRVLGHVDDLAVGLRRNHLYEQRVRGRPGVSRALEWAPQPRQVGVGHHRAGGIGDGDIDHVGVAGDIADQHLQTELVTGEQGGPRTGAEVPRDGVAALAHLLGQRALLRPQQEAADEQHGDGEQRNDDDAEFELERQPHRCLPTLALPAMVIGHGGR